MLINSDSAQNQPRASSDIPSAANFSDALRQLGYKFQTLHSSIEPVFTPLQIAAPAYTVRCYAGATWALEQAIEAAPVGAVLVVDGGGYSEAVLMGGLMSLRARKRGLTGAVIDGAIRDRQELRLAQWPIFAAAATPRAGTHDQQGEWDIPVSCGGVVVHSGDWIVGDDDGVVVIPQSIWEQALQAARQVEQREQAIEASLNAGHSLAEAVTRLQKTTPDQPL